MTITIVAVYKWYHSFYYHSCSQQHDVLASVPTLFFHGTKNSPILISFFIWSTDYIALICCIIITWLLYASHLHLHHSFTNTIYTFLFDSPTKDGFNRALFQWIQHSIYTPFMKKRSYAHKKVKDSRLALLLVLTVVRPANAVARKKS